MGAAILFVTIFSLQVNSLGNAQTQTVNPTMASPPMPGTPPPIGSPRPSGTPLPHLGSPRPSGTPPPMGSPRPSGTPLPHLGSPRPSGTPPSMGSPRPSGTPPPMGSLRPSGTQPPMGSPRPSEPPTPMGSPRPSGTPSPMGSPRPSGTPPPMGSPQPSGTPPLMGSPRPSGTPPPMGSPRPSGTQPPHLGSPRPSGPPPSMGSPRPSGMPPSMGSPRPSGTPPSMESPRPSGTPPSMGSPRPSGTPPPMGSPRPSGTPPPHLGSPRPSGPTTPMGSPRPSGTPPSMGSPRPSGTPPPMESSISSTTPTTGSMVSSTVTPTGSTQPTESTQKLPLLSTPPTVETVSMPATTLIDVSSTVLQTTTPACSPSYCENGRQCSLVASVPRCSCGSKLMGDRCQFKRNSVIATSRTVGAGVRFVSDYNQINSPASIAFFLQFQRYMLACFTLSSNREFARARFQFTLISLAPGSVVTNYRLDIGTNTSSPAFSASDVASSVNSGIAAFASSGGASAFNFSSENTTAIAYNFCTSGENDCSPNAICSPAGTSYSCACRSGYADSDTSNPGTVCTQRCESSVAACNRNGICKAVTGQNFTCECFSGYSGPDCSLVELSPAVLALVIVVPVLFGIIVVMVTAMLCMNRRQRRLKRQVFETMNDAGSPQESILAASQPSVSTNGSRNTELQGRIPRAQLVQPGISNAYVYEQNNLARSEHNQQQSYAFPHKRYADMMFRSGNGLDQLNGGDGYY